MISFESVPTVHNREPFRGTATLVPEAGVTIVTDIDDTIKVTHVLNRKEAKRNTFLKPFEAVPCMADLYNSWRAALGPDTRFHVVSAGPWQFNEPLSLFAESSKFPVMTWDMRSIDIPSASALKVELSQKLEKIFDHKLQKIRALIGRFKMRHFVLVGDSGERDPEVYAQIVSEFMSQVDAVFIRNVHSKAQTEQQAKRYASLFPTKEAKAKLHVFLDPQELPPLPIRSGEVVSETPLVCPK